MKIISPYHDFYDSVLTHYDDSVVYFRTPIEIKIIKGINPLYLEINKRFSDYLCNEYFYNIKGGFQSWSWGDIKGYQQCLLVFKHETNFTLQQHKFLVIFCGKIYPAVKLIKTFNNKQSTIKTVLYNESAFLNYLTENKLKLKTKRDSENILPLITQNKSGRQPN